MESIEQADDRRAAQIERNRAEFEANQDQIAKQMSEAARAYYRENGSMVGW